jgi:hypothetical protein
MNGPFVPHVDLQEPRYYAKVPGGPQTYTLDVLWLQGVAQRSQSFTITKNVGRGFFLYSTPPTEWTDSPIR